MSSFLSLESGPDITFLLPLAREDRLLLRLVVSLSIGISGLPILPCGSLRPRLPIESAFFSPPFRIYWTSRAALTKHRRLDYTTEMYFLRLLEAGNPRSGTGMSGLS